MAAELLINQGGWSYAITAHLQRDCSNNSPVSLVLLLARVLKRSVRGARMPSMVPNMVLRPKLSSIRKKSADQKGLPGSMDMASVKAMKARPVPSTPCKQTWVGSSSHHRQHGPKKTQSKQTNYTTFCISFSRSHSVNVPAEAFPCCSNQAV